jgi:type II secretory pathway pseudopilin PulG
MKLAGQGLPADAGGGARGYAMAALLVGMSVMAVLMGALLPAWTTLATREKEQELVFRGNQYARAIGLFQRKFANTAPPSIDVLVEQRFLRKKYKDPITNDDFQPIFANQAPQGVSAPTGAARPGEQATERLSTPAQQGLQPGFGSTGATGAGGIIGVTSKSKETSLKIYNGRNRYNEWAFVYVQTAQRPQGPGQGVQPGAGPMGPGQQRPGMPQPGQKPGQPQSPGPFGMPPGSFGGPGQRPGGGGSQPGPFSPFSPGGSQPSRPGMPGPRPPGQN